MMSPTIKCTFENNAMGDKATPISSMAQQTAAKALGQNIRKSFSLRAEGGPEAGAGARARVGGKGRDGKQVSLASIVEARIKKRATKGNPWNVAARIMNYQNVFLLVTILLFLGVDNVHGLKCYMCGQYNEGVGSITPCLNYSEKNSSLYLKECSKKSEKYCVKYVSELSTVRDCATECIEKEIWETHTYCCGTDGCNGSNNIQLSALALMVPLICLVVKFIMGLKFQFR